MKIRVATAGDATAIAEIGNFYVRETTVTFNEVEKTEAMVRAEITERDGAMGPFLVAEDDGMILGYASYAQFRKGSGYGRTMEHTVILSKRARGRGLGRSLMAALEADARGRGARSLIGGISGENDAAVAFHQALGFVEVGRVRQAGFKFGRWIDLILLQKMLSEENDTAKV